MARIYIVFLAQAFCNTHQYSVKEVIEYFAFVSPHPQPLSHAGERGVSRGEEEHQKT